MTSQAKRAAGRSPAKRGGTAPPARDPRTSQAQRAAGRSPAKRGGTALLALGLVLGAGCSDELTQLLVVVDSDLPLDAVATVVSPSDATEAPDPVVLQGPLPISFGVLPPGNDPGARVRIELEGKIADETVVVAARVSPFLKGETARLEIFLARACQGHSCPSGQTCSRGTCRAESVSPSELTPVEPGQEITDGGVTEPPPELTVTPDSVDFNQLGSNGVRPKVYLGQVLSAELVLKNVGAGVARNLQAQFQGAGLEAVFAATTLEPGASTTVTVTYRPEAVGDLLTKLQLKADAGDAAQATLRAAPEACPPAVGAETRADPDGTCRLICASGFGDADLDPSNGCECMITDPVDLPDPAGVDSNCDGVDGDRASAVFLAPPPLGDHAGTGTMQSPVATFAQAITLAAPGRKDLYVSRGNYLEAVTVPSGVSVYGGYDAAQGWARRMDAVVRVEASPIAMRVVAAPEAVHLEALTLVARTSADPGAATVALSAHDALELTVADCALVAEAGANGATGGVGAVGDVGVDGMPGATGCEDCPATVAAGQGGAGGTSTCGGGTGGMGGLGGHDANYGTDGVAVGAAVAGFGGDYYDICSTCDWDLCGYAPGEPNFNWGGDGGNGADGATGGPGSASTAEPTTVDGRLVTPSGGAGLDGAAGAPGAGGGGGGGGSSRCAYDASNCSAQAGCAADRAGGGGGGGSGGCGGGGGQGGQGGGASAALVAERSNVSVVRTTLSAANGGAGGAGAAGGEGGAGGVGGDWGMYGGDGGDGGHGGNGGKGGNGGPGAGGAGGSSHCVLRLSGASVTVDAMACTLGTAGRGGAGGGNGAPRGPDGVASEMP